MCLFKHINNIIKQVSLGQPLLPAELGKKNIYIYIHTHLVYMYVYVYIYIYIYVC